MALNDSGYKQHRGLSAKTVDPLMTMLVIVIREPPALI